ncbi:hypothetical protein JCM8202v2_003299 [Rhodotorula sphaerocarpa]
MAQIVSIPGLDIGLLQNGSLVTIGAYANLLGGGDCGPDSTVAVSTKILGLVKVCACVNVAQLGPILGIGGALLGNNQACPPCPDNASAVCGAGKCACQCNSGYYAGPNDVCLPASLCPAPNTVDPTTNTCSCVSPYQSNGSGGCVLAGSQRARSRRHRQQRRDFGKGHGAGQQVYAPASSEGGNASSQMSCPRGETACPLASGGFECVDTTNSLSACGGCPGPEGNGQDCLAIPGALNVQCADSKCIVGSCFRGWHYDATGNGRCQ